MKAVWVDEGNDANYDLLAKHGIEVAYFSHRDPRVTATYLDGVRQRMGTVPGIYTAWSWYPSLTGKQYAEKVDAELKRISYMGNPPVCLDIETHDVAGYVLPCLQRWRQLRPTRATDWTFEPFQGGLFSPAQVSALNSLNVGYAPGFYAGDMSPVGHSVILDLLIGGFDADQMIGMYDAAALPYRWTGYAFTQGRLPVK